MQTRLTTLFFHSVRQDGHINEKNHSLTHREYCLRAAFNQTTQTTELGVFIFFDTIEQLPTKYIISAVCK